MKKLASLLSFLTFYYFSLITLSANAGITPYPAAKGLITSNLYKVKVDNVEIWTEKYGKSTSPTALYTATTSPDI